MWSTVCDLVSLRAKPVSDEMLMLYIWEGINDALGTDSSEVSEDAERIYNGIKKRLADKNIIRKESSAESELTDEFVEKQVESYKRLLKSGLLTEIK